VVPKSVRVEVLYRSVSKSSTILRQSRTSGSDRNTAKAVSYYSIIAPSLSNHGPTKTANISGNCCQSLLWMQGFLPQKLHSSCRKYQHAEKNQSVMPTLDVGGSVPSLTVVNWNLNDL